MARPPLNGTSMTRIVKFRLTDDELAMLRDMMGTSESLSVLLRAMIRAEHKRFLRRK